MSDTVYLVRLREAFNRVDYDDTSAKFNAEANTRLFGSRDQATEFATHTAPRHSPFDTQALDLFSDLATTGSFTVYAGPDEMHWESYVGADGTLGDLSEPLEVDGRTLDSGRRVVESVLIAAVKGAGLPPPAALPGGDSRLEIWRDWWTETVSTMTDAQRAAVWQVFTDNPYLIMELEAGL